MLNAYVTLQTFNYIIPTIIGSVNCYITQKKNVVLVTSYYLMFNPFQNSISF